MAKASNNYIRVLAEKMNKTKLTQKQKDLLDKFVLEFLPDTGEKRKNGSNSLQCVHRSLNTVFSKNANFELSERDVIDCFLRLNYGFRTHVEKWSYLRIPSTVGFYEQVYQKNLELRKKHPRAAPDEHMINISVRGFEVEKIRLSQGRLRETSNHTKTIIPRIEMKMRIKKFFGLPGRLEREDVLPKYEILRQKNE